MSKPSIDDQEMPLVAHLTELRKRLLRCVVAIALLFAGLFYFSQQIPTRWSPRRCGPTCPKARR